jgi:hypothetical protein
MMIVLKKSENGRYAKVRICSQNVVLADGCERAQDERLVRGKTALSADPLAKNY